MRRLLILSLLLLSVITVSAQGPIKRGGGTSTTTTTPSKPKATPAKPKTNTPKSSGIKKSGTTGSTSSRSGEGAKKMNPVIQNLINNMVYVEGGTFIMGAMINDLVYDDQKPTHRVTLSSFYIGRYEVTQEEWQAVMGSNPSEFRGNKNPVDNVSWNDCQEFIRKLNALTGQNFRMPTEAEWEYAARGGNRSRGYVFSGSDDGDLVGWYGFDEQSTHPVGRKTPNELKLYDMTGNVFEWCNDWYGPYSSSSQTNPRGASSGSERVIRGGCAGCIGANCFVFYRRSLSPSNKEDLVCGLRLAR